MPNHSIPLKSVLETIQSGAAYLEGKNVPEARLSMEHMLAKVLDCKRMDLYIQFDRPLGEDELAPMREMLKKRGQRVPLQHVLGNVDFYGRLFGSDGRALIARPETEDLVTEALRIAKEKATSVRVLDVGTGSGVIGLTMAAELGENLDVAVLVDCSADAMALATENRALLELSAENVIIGESDLLRGDTVADNAPYDLILANLPYIPSAEIASLGPEVHADPVLALDGGADGLDLVRRLLADVGDLLSPGGWVGLELASGQAEEVAELAHDQGLDETCILADMSAIDRFVFARKP